MLTIGFSRKFYTLWDCTVNENTDDRGIKHIVYSNRYIKNISFDEAVAKSKYPNAPFDETLKGHYRSFNYSKIVYPDDMFKFGKYRGQYFNEVQDYDYMKWYFTQTDKESQKILIPILESHGYHIFAYFDKTLGIMTNEEYEAQVAHENKLMEERNRVIDGFNNGTLTFSITHNPDSNGECYDRESEFYIRFDKVRENWYQGISYYLPEVNGKCKRVKNKTIKIVEGEIDGNTVFVHKFEIVK